MLFNKKKVLILGGSSDIGKTLVNILSQNNRSTQTGMSLPVLETLYRMAPLLDVLAGGANL